jgi:hypothetical protein
MGRKNYPSRTARRRNVTPGTPEGHASDYSIVMTNGSGYKVITVSGSPVSSWNWAVKCGLNENDATMPGVWWPVDMSLAGSGKSMFTAV